MNPSIQPFTFDRMHYPQQKRRKKNVTYRFLNRRGKVPFGIRVECLGEEYLGG